MSVEGRLRRALEALRYLSGLVEAQLSTSSPGVEHVVDAYAETRRVLAREFRAIAAEGGGESLLEQTRARIEQRMTALFSTALPSMYLVVRGLHHPHAELLAYLVRNVGKPVTSSRLRVLTGDQVHTERRVRDLRSFGYPVVWKSHAGENRYILESLEPDLDTAARLHATKNIKADRRLRPSERAELLRLVAAPSNAPSDVA